MNQFHTRPVPVVAITALICFSANVEVFARQSGRPAPQTPEVHAQPTSPQADTTQESKTNGAAMAATAPDKFMSSVPGRKPLSGNVTAIGFKDVPVDEDIIQFIMESTGKVVMPVNLNSLRNKKVTLINDQPMSREYALNLLFEALRLNGVGVIERDDVIILDDITNMQRHPNLPVLTADDDVMKRSDTATFVVKYYRLRESNAESVADHLDDNIPEWATVAADATSNQIIVYGTVGFAQTIQREIDVLDHFFVNIKTETFHLQYADAQQVADNILDLFEDTSNGQSSTQRNRTTQRGQRTPPQPQGGAPNGIPTAGPTIPLKLTVNVQQNSVTVSAEPPKVAQIEQLIRNDFDLPRRQGTAKVYKLLYTDPIKIRDTLQTLLGQGSSSGQRSGGGRAGGGFQGGNGQAANVTETIGNIYQLEAYPDSNSLVVLSKTEEALDWLDSVVEGLDQPSDVYLPLFIELKHANAISLAEELNALLSEAGAGATIEKPAETLTAPTLDAQSADSTTGASPQTGTNQQSNDTMQFPWERGRQDETRADPSPLIGTVRIVPIVRQNALTVVCPVSQREAMRHLIELYDRPARQVMIEAVIAQIELTDNSALGVRVSSNNLTSSLNDNSFAGNADIKLSKDDFLGGNSWFDTATLDVGTNINVLIQAINEKNNVRVLQRPRVFTADNQEALFFNGQDVPFISNSLTTDQGGQNQSFSYKRVGMQLNVRPRITVERDIDMDINLELSNIVPGQTLFGGFIVDRRTTTSRIIVRNRQPVVLSGIIREDESNTTHGIPGLSDIPLLGELFKSREKTKTRTEIIAFITPIVVDNPSANDDNFNADERKYLEELTGPLKDQSKHPAKSARDRIIEHVTNPRPEPNNIAPMEQPESVRPSVPPSTDEQWEEVKPE
ncbi:MAG TPA: secretin N-terminal domain-containing protein [Phycisphaerales bacterium]|nr:secretin N-terminal domain-containing protein [Phycisphaerales bacterium]